jgi:hypothetical protein
VACGRSGINSTSQSIENPTKALEKRPKDACNKKNFQMRKLVIITTK